MSTTDQIATFFGETYDRYRQRICIGTCCVCGIPGNDNHAFAELGHGFDDQGTLISCDSKNRHFWKDITLLPILQKIDGRKTSMTRLFISLRGLKEMQSIHEVLSTTVPNHGLATPEQLA